MRKTTLFIALAAAALVGAAAGTVSLRAASTHRVRAFQALLTAGQEPQKPDSYGFGLGFFTLNEATRTVDYSVTVYSLAGSPSSMHLHNGPPGVDGPIVTPLVGPADSSAQVTGTTLALTATDVAALKKGLFYVNVHTDFATGGEIRGQLLPSAVTYRVPNVAK